MASLLLTHSSADKCSVLRQLLVDILNTVHTAHDSLSLAQYVLEHTVSTTTLAGASIWQPKDDGMVCLARYSTSAPAQPSQERAPGLLLEQAFKSRQPMFIEPPPSGGAYRTSSRPAGPLAILPLVAGEAQLGVIVFECSSAPTPDDQATLTALASQIACAIRQFQLAQLVERQRQQLRAISTQKDEFISITSHELKNPMASIKGYADLLLRRAAKNPGDPNRKGLEIISQQVGRMTSLLDQLLDVSRIGLDRLQLEQRPLNLTEVARHVFEDMRVTTEQHQLFMESDNQPLIGIFDEPRIRQVFTNLLSNAIKYSPEGGPITLRLRRVEGQHGPEALISVSDRGIGIPAEDREMLFERFFRASNAGDAFAGLGLGLYITRGIVTRHGGRIWVESQEGQGSTFYVALPLAQSNT